MAYVRIFARARVIRLLAALCAVSALAFVLGQGAAAVRENLVAQPQTTDQSQVLERVTGAQGVARPTSTPTATGARNTTPVTFSTDDKHTPKARPLTAQQPLKPKDKPQDNHSSHKKAAGDKSHGGLHHQKGDKGNKRNKDGAQQSGAQQDAQSKPGKLDKQSKQGNQDQQGTQGAQTSHD